MSFSHRAASAVVAGLTLLACGGGTGGGSGGTYTSVDDDAGVLELKSGGTFTFTVPGLASSQGPYTVDGEKIVLTMDGQTHTLIKTGNCLEDARQVFSRMCVGGKAGEAATAAMTPAAEAPSGVWRATSGEGDFTLEFKPGNTLTMTASPPGGPAETHQGTFVVEGRTIHARIGQGGDPLVLSLVNNVYESNSFGFPMKFVKQ